MHAPVVVVARAGTSAWVDVPAGSACVACREGVGCGADRVLLNHPGPHAGEALRVPNSAGIGVGERAWLRVPARGLALAAALVLGMPLAGFLAGALVVPGLLELGGMTTSTSDWPAATGAALGLGAALLGSRHLPARYVRVLWSNLSLVTKVPYER